MLFIIIYQSVKCFICALTQLWISFKVILLYALYHVFKNSFIEIQPTYHSGHLFKVYSSVALSIFRVM